MYDAFTNFLYSDIVDPSTGLIMQSSVLDPPEDSPDELGSLSNNQDASMHPNRRRRVGYVPPESSNAFTTPRRQPKVVVPEMSPKSKALRDKISVPVHDSPNLPYSVKRTSSLRQEVPRDSPIKLSGIDSSSPSTRSQNAPPTPGPEDTEDADDEGPPAPPPAVSAATTRQCNMLTVAARIVLSSRLLTLTYSSTQICVGDVFVVSGHARNIFVRIDLWTGASQWWTTCEYPKRLVDRYCVTASSLQLSSYSILTPRPPFYNHNYEHGGPKTDHRVVLDKVILSRLHSDNSVRVCSGENPKAFYGPLKERVGSPSSLGASDSYDLWSLRVKDLHCFGWKFYGKPYSMRHSGGDSLSLLVSQ